MLSPLHNELIAKKQIHGIEIANGPTYSAEAFQIALDNDLTLIGVSDIHDLIDWDFPPHKGEHRPVTLILAKERSEGAIRDALFEKRTVVWYRNMLLGRDRELLPLLEASLKVTSAEYLPDTSTLQVTLANTSDASFELDTKTDVSFAAHDGRFVVPAHEEATVILTLPDRVQRFTLVVEVENALLAPGRPADMTFTLELPGS